MDKKHIGGDFDDFLRDEHMLDDAEAVAAKRVIAFQISQEMERCHITYQRVTHDQQTAAGHACDSDYLTAAVCRCVAFVRPISAAERF